MGCYGSFSNNNYDGRFLFYFFKKENNETELWYAPRQEDNKK